MHGATPNLSNGPRIAAVMAIRTAGSDWIYHYLEKGAENDQIEKYEVNLETFITLGKDSRPTHAKLLGNIAWDFPQISRPDFVEGMKMYSDKNPFKAFWNKLSNVGESLLSR